ncbi:MAG: YggT family protein [Treponema sp.]|nr:YggT family protein [Treponema sp.]
MQTVFNFLISLIGIYTLLIFIRIMISWFAGAVTGKPVEILSRITDPYLDWWRRNFSLRFANIDLSPVAGIAALSLLQNILSAVSGRNRITIFGIMAVIVQSLWSVISFILGFFILIIILRLIAYLTNRDIYNVFWQAVDSVSRPVLFKINRLLFKDQIVTFPKGIIIPAVLLTAIWAGGKILIPVFVRFLSGLPF